MQNLLLLMEIPSLSTARTTNKDSCRKIEKQQSTSCINICAKSQSDGELLPKIYLEEHLGHSEAVVRIRDLLFKRSLRNNRQLVFLFAYPLSWCQWRIGLQIKRPLLDPLYKTYLLKFLKQQSLMSLYYNITSH